MVIVFLITGLQLNTSELKRALALRNLPVVLYGFVAILIATPCLGFALREAPLDPWEFAAGLAIFCTAPTTLGVGVALTEACGGNRAMALLLTVGTNALAVFTMPPELRLLLPPGHAADGAGDGGGDGAAAGGPGTLNLHIQVTDLLVKLAVTVLVPFTLGKAVREMVPAVEAFTKTHRVPLSLTSTSLLAFVVWQTLSAARDQLLAQRPGPVMAVIGLAVALHLTYLVANYLVVWWVLRAPLREAIAVVIMASQKSAPVAVTTLTFMTRDSAQQGLLSLPSIVGQLCQIFIGAALARWLSAVVERATELEKAAAAAAAQTTVASADVGSGGSGEASSAAVVVPGGLRLEVRPGETAAVAATAAAIATSATSSSSRGHSMRNKEDPYNVRQLEIGSLHHGGVAALASCGGRGGSSCGGDGNDVRGGTGGSGCSAMAQGSGGQLQSPVEELNAQRGPGQGVCGPGPPSPPTL